MSDNTAERIRALTDTGDPARSIENLLRELSASSLEKAVLLCERWPCRCSVRYPSTIDYHSETCEKFTATAIGEQIKTLVESVRSGPLDGEEAQQPGTNPQDTPI